MYLSLTFRIEGYKIVHFLPKSFCWGVRGQRKWIPRGQKIFCLANTPPPPHKHNHVLSLSLDLFQKCLHAHYQSNRTHILLPPSLTHIYIYLTTLSNTPTLTTHNRFPTHAPRTRFKCARTHHAHTRTRTLTRMRTDACALLVCAAACGSACGEPLRGEQSICQMDLLSKPMI